MVDVVETEPGVAVITRVITPHAKRGKGQASEAMRATCRDADREGVTLLLEVQPYGDGGLSIKQLKAWYSRLGFKESYGGSGLMMRKPRARG